MPLATCPDCGRQVADTTLACPGCGRPFGMPGMVVARPVKKGMSTGAIVLVVAGCLLVAGVLVVAIAAVGVAAVARPKYAAAQTSQAKVHARTIHPAAEKYRADHPTEPCPTMETLRDNHEISTHSKLTDPWDSPYKISCADGDVSVISFGPDKTEGTADDIRVPASP